MTGLPPPETPDGYNICPSCGHHTSAFCGACGVINPETLAYCGCDCVKAMTGESLTDRIARSLWGDKPSGGPGS